MENKILDYRATLAYNSETFLIQHGVLAKVFMDIDDNFDSLLRPLSEKRDSHGYSHISLIPFIVFLQRQARAAFELFSRDQSYQGWVLLRPGIESILIIGKWLDDPANATIWNQRHKNREAYIKNYTGKALKSKSLRCSSQIRSVLSKVNDDFVHPNPEYYSRHLSAADQSAEDITIKIDYFDNDAVQEIHVLAFLHLLLVMQDNLSELFSKLFTSPVVLPKTLKMFKEVFSKRIVVLMSQNPLAKNIFIELGAWEV
jgi:hypothetical protein